MTIENHTPPTPTAVRPSDSVHLNDWAAELSAAHGLATALCATPFAPKEFQGKPEAGAAAILTGKSLGMDPLQSLANVFVIHGKPAMYARTMLGLVQAAGHEVERVKASPDEVVYRARRDGADEWQEFSWSIDRAHAAGYTSNSRYKSNPIEMLSAKCIAEACRNIGADVLMGMSMTVEEVELEDLGEVKTTLKRQPRKKVEEETVVDTETGETS